MKKDMQLVQNSVLKLAFLTAMCERFGFYVLSFLVTLYAKEVLGYSDTAAFAVFSVFTALAYITPPLGGYLADHIFGIRRCIFFGLLIEGVGLALLVAPSHVIFNLGLVLVAIGVGFFKTGPTHLLGRSYKKNDPRIDSGFTIYYMGLNLGAIIPAIFIGIVQRYWGWSAAFIIGGISLFVGIGFYFLFRQATYIADSAPGKKSLSLVKIIYLILGFGLVALAAYYLISYVNIGQTVIACCSAGILLYFGYELVVSPKREKLQIIACLGLILTGMIFFVIYFQLFTSFALFIQRCVARQVFGFEVPTVAYFSLNCFFGIVISPVLAKIYTLLHKHRSDLAVTTKFSLGLLVSALSFFVLILGIKTANFVGQVSSWWIVLAYFLITVGELLISALGVAMVTRIAPKRMYGVMMGTWFLIAMSFAAWISKLFADLSSVPANVHNSVQILQIYNGAFFKIGVVCLVFTAISFVTGPYLKRIAKI